MGGTRRRGVAPNRTKVACHGGYLAIDTIEAKASFAQADKTVTTLERRAGGRQLADVVLCSETLEHIAELEVFLAEMRRCLRPAGEC